jgi:hypothetical protein
MHDLLIVLRNLSIYEPGVGRRDLRPGATVNMPPEMAERFVKSGHLRRVVAENREPAKPMKRRRKEPPQDGR